MTDKRFTMGKSENQNTIFDNEGPDDYYHLGNDTQDVKGICELLNELSQDDPKLIEENNKLRNTVSELSSTILKITEENEQLKAVNEYLIRLLESTGATVEIKNIKGDFE